MNMKVLRVNYSGAFSVHKLESTMMKHAQDQLLIIPQWQAKLWGIGIDNKTISIGAGAQSTSTLTGTLVAVQMYISPFGDSFLVCSDLGISGRQPNSKRVPWTCQW